MFTCSSPPPADQLNGEQHAPFANDIMRDLIEFYVAFHRRKPSLDHGLVHMSNSGGPFDEVQITCTRSARLPQPPTHGQQPGWQLHLLHLDVRAMIEPKLLSTAFTPPPHHHICDNRRILRVHIIDERRRNVNNVAASPAANLECRRKYPSLLRLKTVAAQPASLTHRITAHCQTPV